MASITQNHNMATSRWDHLEDSIAISPGSATSWEALVSEKEWPGNNNLKWIMINGLNEEENKCLICNLISLRCYILCIKYGNAKWMT